MFHLGESASINDKWFDVFMHHASLPKSSNNSFTGMWTSSDSLIMQQVLEAIRCFWSHVIHPEGAMWATYEPLPGHMWEWFASVIDSWRMCMARCMIDVCVGGCVWLHETTCAHTDLSMNKDSKSPAQRNKAIHWYFKRIFCEFWGDCPDRQNGRPEYARYISVLFDGQMKSWSLQSRLLVRT